MAHSLNRVLVHMVWTTHMRAPYLTDDIRPAVFEHLRATAFTLDYHVLALDGWLDHVHLFLRLPRAVPFATVANRLKGESAHWINETKLTHDHFRWQRGYAAFSVSESDRGAVQRYVENQQQHHTNQNR